MASVVRASNIFIYLLDRDIMGNKVIKSADKTFILLDNDNALRYY